jgi:hypothetical protein
MGKKVSACLYLDSDVLETAKKLGLNVSKVSENALVEAIGLLTGAKPEIALGSRARAGGGGRGPGARLHRPIGYQATSTQPIFYGPISYADNKRNSRATA